MDGNKDEMEITKDQVRQLNEKLDRVLSYLHDDLNTGRKGMYSELQDMKVRVLELETMNKISSAKKALLIFIGGLIVSVISWIIKLIY